MAQADRIPYWPGLMSQATAARYCDMTVKEFERAIGAGDLPCPIIVGGMERWQRIRLDDYLDRDAAPDWRASSKLYAAS